MFGEESLKEGDTAGVQCVILSGDLPANLSWMFNGHPLAITDNVIITKTGLKTLSLTIDSVSAKDAGNYTCVGENTVGNTTFTSTLFINGWLVELASLYVASMRLSLVTNVWRVTQYNPNLPSSSCLLFWAKLYRL